MIDLEDVVEVTITNQGKYFRNLGYGECKQRSKIMVKIGHLQPNSNKLVPFVCDVCGVTDMLTFQTLNMTHRNLGRHQCRDCSYALRGEKIGSINRGKERPHKRGVNHPRYRQKTTHEKQYHRVVRILTELVYERNLNVLNPAGLKRGRCGESGAYQLDHIVSVREAYKNRLDIRYVVSPQNLRMISWEENLEKRERSGIDIEELKRIVDESGFDLPEIEMYGSFDNLKIESEEERKERLRKSSSEAGKKGGLKNVLNKTGIFSRTKEKRVEDGRRASLRGKELGVGIYSLTREQLSENGKKGRLGKTFKYYNDGNKTYQYFDTNELPFEDFMKHNPQFTKGRVHNK